MAMGVCTDGSAAKTVALKPVDSRIFATASTSGIGTDWSGPELYGTGKSDAHKLKGVSSDRSTSFMVWLEIFFSYFLRIIASPLSQVREAGASELFPDSK